MFLLWTENLHVSSKKIERARASWYLPPQSPNPTHIRRPTSPTTSCIFWAYVDRSFPNTTNNFCGGPRNSRPVQNTSLNSLLLHAIFGDPFPLTKSRIRFESHPTRMPRPETQSFFSSSWKYPKRNLSYFHFAILRLDLGPTPTSKSYKYLDLPFSAGDQTC